jgi:hypothetical protein
MNPTPEKPSPELFAQQVLELLAEHIASNDRVVAAVEHAETNIPKEADRILHEHRQSLANLPAPVPAERESDIPAVKKYLSEVIHLWGTIVVILIVASSCTVLFFVLRR